jgi:ribose transport system substrate-binding protein
MKATKIFAAAALACLFAASFAAPPASADSKLKSSDELYNSYVSATKGKRIAWVPQALGLPLTDGWTKEMKDEAAALGMELIVRDPNWSTAAMSQAVTALIAEKPDVLVVHNPNVQLLARQLKQAQDAGIYVVQLNMVSNQKTDAFVGGDWKSLARDMALDIVKTCGKDSGKSGKVAIIQGELTSDVSILEMEGAKEVFSQHPEITIVSDQAAMWDPNKAREITASVLQQHPDLCAILGHWGPMTMGAGQAVKAANLTDKVSVYSTGENPQMICDAVKDGVLTKYWSVDNEKQGRDAMLTIKYLLQMKQPPGSYKLAAYSPFEVITRDNAGNGLCWR